MSAIMRIALINPSRNASFQPVNLAMLAAACIAEHGDKIQIRIFDFAVDQRADVSIGQWMPHVIGITCLSSDLLVIEELIHNLRPKLRDCVFVCGGIHASIAPEDVLAAGADIAVIGEGETAFCELLQVTMSNPVYPAHSAWSSVFGICYRDSAGTLHRTPLREPISNIDALPHPARHLLNNQAYARRFFIQRGMRTNRVFTLHGSRGCPFRCYFCCVNFTVPGKVRLHSPEYIADEMEILVNKYRAKWIFFTDDTIFVNKQHTASLCTEILRRGLHKRVKWEAQLRSSLVKDEDIDLLRQMRTAGCRQVDIGFESGNQRVLDMIKGKGITLEDHRRALALAKESKIDVLGTFIIANPTETFAEMMDTVRFIQDGLRSGGLTRFQYGIVVPFPGTRLYAMAADEGVVPPRYIDLLKSKSGAGFGSVLCTRHSTPQEVASVSAKLDALGLQLLTWRDKTSWAAHNMLHNPNLVFRTVWHALAKNKP